MKQTDTVNSSNNRIKTIIKLCGRILSVLSVIFVAVKIYRLGFDIRSIDNVVAFIVVFLLVLIFKVLSVVSSAAAWGKWISFLSKQKIRYSSVFTIYGKAGIGKYLPGNVMHYVERNVFASEYGLPQTKIAFGSVIEVAELVLTAFLMAIFLLPNAFKLKIIEMISSERSILLISGLLMLALLIIIAAVIGIRKLKLITIIREYEPKEFVVSLLITLFEYGMSLTLLATGMVFLCVYCNKTIPSADELRLILSSYSTAWVCGFVIPGASGGIGIREAVLTMLLDGVASGPVLMFVIVVHRLITIIGDFVVYAFVVGKEFFLRKIVH